MDNLQTYFDKAMDLIMVYGAQVLLALITLWIGLALISFVTKLLGKSFKKHDVDESLRPFLISLTTWILKAVLFISIASMVGIATTSFVAILGAAGLAVGLALQGTLANFAGGVLILLFKPFRVGHTIEAQGYAGTVTEIQIFVTKLVTGDGKTVIIPNGVLSNGSIVNNTEKGEMRVDLHINVAYDADLKVAREALISVMSAHPKVLASPAPFVGVGKLGAGSITLEVRSFCLTGDYWTVFFEVQEQAKLALDAKNVKIPVPYLDVNMLSKS